MDEKTLDQLSADDSTLYIAADVSKTTWVLALTDRSSRRPTETSVEAWDLVGLEEKVRAAQQRLGVADGRVVFCHEAGRDQFSIHRTLVKHFRWVSLVVDPASIETNRRSRTAKTDRIDARKLLMKLRSFVCGDRDVLSVLRVPSVEDEDRRRLMRARQALKKERARHINRIKAAMAQVGQPISQLGSGFIAFFRQADTAWGDPLPPGLKAQVLRDLERLELVDDQLACIERESIKAVREQRSVADEQAAKLSRLRGVGMVTALTLSREFFAWRDFKNRREVGAAAGLVGTPLQTGLSTDRERGITKSGNHRVRSLMVEISWLWLRFQPESRITRWYNERLADSTSRSKKRLIVAVARRLLIEFWHYLKKGNPPKGAILAA